MNLSGLQNLKESQHIEFKSSYKGRYYKRVKNKSIYFKFWQCIGSFFSILGIISILFPISATATARSIQQISVAYCKDTIPFHFTDEKGEPAGIMIDLWRLWSEKTGITIHFQPAVWEETLKKVGSGAVDAHAGLFFQKERDKYLDYGVKLTNTGTHYFTHKTLPAINKISDTKHEIGVIAGDFVERYLKDRLPNNRVIPFTNYDSLMKALQKGSIRIFAADTPTGLFHLKKTRLISEFTYTPEKPLYQSDWFVAVKEGNKSLIETINQGMSLITEKEKREINQHWLGSTDNKGEILTISMDSSYVPFTGCNTKKCHFVKKKLDS